MFLRRSSIALDRLLFCDVVNCPIGRRSFEGYISEMSEQG